MANKHQAREELQRLVAQYTGEISRNARIAKATLVCKLCPNRSYHELAHALQFRPRCRKCGGEMQTKT